MKKKFTLQEKINGEMAMRNLSKGAYEVYCNTDPLDIYEYGDGLYAIRKFDERDDMTFEEVNEYFEDLGRDLMDLMVGDFLVDNAEEMEDLVLDGKPYYSEDGFWVQDAHDEKHSYMLVHENGDGDIQIYYGGTK